MSTSAQPSFTISTDPALLDVDLIHRFLRESYWAKDLPRPVLERAIQNSLCFGAYTHGRQAGFGRVITDFATFGYLADIFVLPEFRNRGVARLLVKAMLDEPRLEGLRRWLLATHDAHGLYKKFGFEPLARPEDFLTIHNPNIYQRKSGGACV